MNGNKLQCFSGTTDGGYNGTCTVDKSGTATLDNNDGDLDPNNNYSGVYLQNTNLDGKLIGAVTKLAFSYSGGPLSGGSPRVTAPIDTDGDGGWDDFVSVDALGCDGEQSGTVDAINDATCNVSMNSGGPVYPNWAAFVAANPTYRVAKDALSFIIADQPGLFTITNAQLGKAPAGGAKP